MIRQRLFLVPMLSIFLLLIPIIGVFLMLLIWAIWYLSNQDDIHKYIKGDYYNKIDDTNENEDELLK